MLRLLDILEVRMTGYNVLNLVLRNNILTHAPLKLCVESDNVDALERYLTTYEGYRPTANQINPGHSPANAGSDKGDEMLSSDNGIDRDDDVDDNVDEGSGSDISIRSEDAMLPNRKAARPGQCAIGFLVKVGQGDHVPKAAATTCYEIRTLDRRGDRKRVELVAFGSKRPLVSRLLASNELMGLPS